VRFISVLYVLHCLLVINIQDGLKNAAKANRISSIRNLAVELRTPPKISEKLMKAGLLMAVLDQERRQDGAALILWWSVSKEFMNESVELITEGLSSTVEAGTGTGRPTEKPSCLPRSSFLMTSLLVISGAKWTGLRRMFS
jgi:hypothetical protein